METLSMALSERDRLALLWQVETGQMTLIDAAE